MAPVAATSAPVIQAVRISIIPRWVTRLIRAAVCPLRLGAVYGRQTTFAIS